MNNPYKIMYSSQANSNLSKKDLVDILSQARKFNASKDITGCLLYNRGVFVQYLEGPPNELQQLYQSIKKDHRHHSVRTLCEGYTSSRAFSTWRMAFKEIPFTKPGEEKNLEKLLETMISTAEIAILCEQAKLYFELFLKLNGDALMPQNA